MKAHTNDFKNTVKKFGREIDSIISYELEGETIELGGEELNSVTPHYEGAILKSVMRQLDIDSNVEIPVGTILNYQFGVKIDDEYEYISFGNYIVYSSKKQEDTNSYKIVCYDKMLYSMKDYESLGITYPVTVRNYISAICTHLGLTFKNASDNFANYDKQIPLELYLTTNGESLGYTFRDVLDELAQVTASTICINEEDDELEIRYINNTGDTINEEYLKDINVNFGEYYGPINTIVLSRTGGSDNIYLSQPQDLPEEQRNAIKIVDNQIMNRNDRDSYMSDILNRLYGLQYYLNDFSSTGITYYDLCDKYNVQIGENTYTCIMFNDEVDITQGLEEKVYTDMPEESETDYTKADKTDRRINQTYLIVDKQNQVIEGVASQVSEQNEQIAIIRLQYNELLSRISDIADITTSAEDTDASVTLENINASQPISIKIHPIVENISYLHPYNGLYPSSNLYPKPRKLRFINTTTNEIFDWILPTDLWYYDSNNYDELELSYGDGSNSNVIVNRKCKINADNSVSVLANPTTETYSYPSDILLTDGDYTVSLVDNTMGYLYVQLMAQNIYTTQFYTKAETNSLINQTASSITIGVNQTLSNYSTTSEMNAAINVKANEINSVVSTKVGNNEVISKINQSSESITINANKVNLQGYVTATDLSGTGTTTINGANITTGTINADRVSGGTLQGTSIIANSGVIAGWNINDYGLQKTSGNYSVEIRPESNPNNAMFVVWDNVNNTYNWYVNGAGKMFARNAEISGTVNAYSGTFDNVTINNSCSINGYALKTGAIQNLPYSFNNSSNGSVVLGDSSEGSVTGYRGSSIRWALAAFTNGGRFQTFDSNGSMAAYFNHTGAHTSSDIRLKSNIVNISEKESFDIINNLTPIQYTYKADESSYHRGLSAQEVEQVLKENGIEKQIYEIDKEGKYSLNYIELIPDLINCIKYLNEKIEKLERESDK